MSQRFPYRRSATSDSSLPTPPVAIVARRLALHSTLDDAATAALEPLLGRPTQFQPRALIAEAGDVADLITIVHDGFACRTSVLPDGRRQIHSLFLPGDTADAEAPLLRLRLDNVEALSRCSVWLVPKTRLADLVRTQPRLAAAFAREAAIAAQVAREWVVNIGQRTALERVAHLICEMHARLGAIGRVSDETFLQPLTQQEIADAQGLSAVHVNRVLQELRAERLIQTEGRSLTVLDLQRLQQLAMFDPLYLHLRTEASNDSPM